MKRRMLCLGLLSIVFDATATTGVARIVSYSGDVRVNGREVRVGDEIPAGLVIRTGTDGMAKLLLVDKSIVDLAKDTSFTVETSVPEVGSTTKLDYGTVRSSIQKRMEKKIKFQMRTRTSVLAVRGTEFIVRSVPGNSGRSFQDQVTVREGQVMAGVGASAQTLNAGDQLMAMGRLVNNQVQVDTGAMRVVQLKPEVMQAVVNNATVPDTTFISRVEVSEKPMRAPMAAPNTAPGAPTPPPPPPPPGGGESTLSVAMNNVIRDPGNGTMGGPMVPGGVDTSRRPPPPPPVPIGGLNVIDQSAAQNSIIQGVRLHVIFRP